MKVEDDSNLRQIDRLSLKLMMWAMIAGVLSGLVVVGYRTALVWGDKTLRMILSHAQERPVYMVLWFLCLIVLAVIVGRIIMWEPMISGGGVPQVVEEANGKINQVWWKVLTGKIAAGFLALLAGLSLGRAGPSIQMGAMVGKGVSQVFKCEKKEEYMLFACGAGAGLAGTFHTPLTGIFYIIEKVYRRVTLPFLVVLSAAVFAADFVSYKVGGDILALGFDISYILPGSAYWMIPVLGLFLGIMASMYNQMVPKCSVWYKKVFGESQVRRLFFPFILAGVLGFCMPEVLGGGQSLLDPLVTGQLVLRTAVILFIMKFLFSVLSISSGVSGGIFFPVMIMGAMCGGIFALAGVAVFDMPLICVNYFVALGVAGYFSAVMKTPITAVIMLMEMTGSASQLIVLAVVSVVSCWISNVMEGLRYGNSKG